VNLIDDLDHPFRPHLRESDPRTPVLVGFMPPPTPPMPQPALAYT